MAWWEWIPVVSTVGHAWADPKGRKTADYAACATTAADCAAGAPIAITKCSTCIDSLMLKYIGDWIGAPLAADFFKAAVGGTTAAIANHLAKELAKDAAKKGAAKVAAAATGVGLLITIDGFLDAGIIITKAVQIYKAAQSAKATLCVCPPPPVVPGGGVGVVGGGGSDGGGGAENETEGDDE